MRVKEFYLLICLSCLLLLSSCQRGEGESVSTEASEQNTEQETEEEEIPTNGFMTEEEFEAYVKDFDAIYSEGNIAKLGSNSFALLDGIVYYMSGYMNPSWDKSGFSVFRYDCETGENEPCRNRDGKYVFYGDEYVRGCWVLNGKLYMMRLEDENWYLCEVNPQDFSMKQICRVCEKEGLIPEEWRDGDPWTFSYITGESVCLHGNYVYANQEGDRIIRVEMEEGAEPEVFYQVEKGKEIGIICFSGNVLIVLEANVGNEEKTLYGFDLDTGDVITIETELGSGVYRSFTLTEKQELFYWKENEGIMKYSHETGEKSVFCSDVRLMSRNGRDKIYYDGRFIYCELTGDILENMTEESPKRQVHVISMDGEILTSIEYQNDGEFVSTQESAFLSRVEWVETPYVIFGYITNPRPNSDAVMSVLDKKKFFTEGVEEWNPLEYYEALF